MMSSAERIFIWWNVNFRHYSSEVGCLSRHLKSLIHLLSVIYRTEVSHTYCACVLLVFFADLRVTFVVASAAMCRVLLIVLLWLKVQGSSSISMYIGTRCLFSYVYCLLHIVHIMLITAAKEDVCYSVVCLSEELWINFWNG